MKDYVKAAIAFAFMLLLTTASTGCTIRISKQQEDMPSERFTVDDAGGNIQILTDTQTGVQYLVYKTPMGTGITKLDAGEENG